MWGTNVENTVHPGMSAVFERFIMSLPLFTKYDSAVRFAELVDKANETGNGILIIRTFKDTYVDQIRRKN